mmetsp:Transcript_30414/g.51255  ORF Transcript_30414/g.51255 Transcript_30414/m.51255 type:complete len:419 (+) Transcript_30414:737-1993(+)
MEQILRNLHGGGVALPHLHHLHGNELVWRVTEHRRPRGQLVQAPPPLEKAQQHHGEGGRALHVHEGVAALHVLHHHRRQEVAAFNGCLLLQRNKHLLDHVDGADGRVARQNDGLLPLPAPHLLRLKKSLLVGATQKVERARDARQALAVRNQRLDHLQREAVRAGGGAGVGQVLAAALQEPDQRGAVGARGSKRGQVQPLVPDRTVGPVYDHVCANEVPVVAVGLQVGILFLGDPILVYNVGGQAQREGGSQGVLGARQHILHKHDAAVEVVHEQGVVHGTECHPLAVQREGVLMDERVAVEAVQHQLPGGLVHVRAVHAAVHRQQLHVAALHRAGPGQVAVGQAGKIELGQANETGGGKLIASEAHRCRHAGCQQRQSGFVRIREPSHLVFTVVNRTESVVLGQQLKQLEPICGHYR